MMKRKDNFLTKYLDLRREVETKYGIPRPDPVAILIYYICTYTEVTEPRAIHRLLEVPLDRVLDRLCKMGFITLPPKDTVSDRRKGKSLPVDIDINVDSKPDVELTPEDKLMGFMIK